MAGVDDSNPRKERLTVAELRRARPLKLFGGRGSGATCDLCRVVIDPNDPEYEVDAELDGGKLALHFHVKCYDAWRDSRDSPDPEESRDADDDTSHESAA
jgi:hypothetical protein